MCLGISIRLLDSQIRGHVIDPGDDVPGFPFGPAMDRSSSDDLVAAGTKQKLRPCR